MGTEDRIDFGWWIDYANSDAFRLQCERVARRLGEDRGREYVESVIAEYKALALSNEFFEWADKHIREAESRPA